MVAQRCTFASRQTRRTGRSRAPGCLKARCSRRPRPPAAHGCLQDQQYGPLRRPRPIWRMPLQRRRRQPARLVARWRRSRRIGASRRSIRWRRVCESGDDAAEAGTPPVGGRRRGDRRGRAAQITVIKCGGNLNLELLNLNMTCESEVCKLRCRELWDAIDHIEHDRRAPSRAGWGAAAARGAGGRGGEPRSHRRRRRTLTFYSRDTRETHR